MRYIDEYRKKDLILAVAAKLKAVSKKEIVLMEVCGGHTMAIHRFGLTSLLPSTIRLISGPGCPVCVSSQRFIDLAMNYSKVPGVIITTYGDLIRVPGSVTSLEKENLAYSCRYMVWEQSIRFLTDYLNGDTYYKIAYPDHNKVRTLSQVRYLEVLEENAGIMEQIVASAL